MRFHAPVRGIGMCRMLAHEHLEVYLLDEYNTSKICPTCQSPTRLRPYLQVENPRPFRRAQFAFVRCWGLLRCTHCVSALAMDGLQVQGYHWNRDVLACCNMRNILLGLRSPARAVPPIYQRPQLPPPPR
ncbi:hypothetical protein DM01DRAFT_1133970 [Hesseltinella vesiculosa]|uniref:Uncharacterized protein n=1 Tax=Hesseltinella vesiculosa TaxID=101127 RepID=A0A1X2G8U4_9FUNG|nr:hypothetical protein DM01DRAFT_1133970 [Hesseltinella vesiculosa]